MYLKQKEEVFLARLHQVNCILGKQKSNIKKKMKNIICKQNFNIDKIQNKIIL